MTTHCLWGAARRASSSNAWLWHAGRGTTASIVCLPVRRLRGPTDKAPDHESGDCEFESHRR